MGTRLFVGRLPHSTNKQDLATMFEPSGKVESVRVALDKETGLSRGFGFVRMSSLTEAENAISRLHSTEMEGRKLIVRVAKSQGEKAGHAPRTNGGAEPKSL